MWRLGTILLLIAGCNHRALTSATDLATVTDLATATDLGANDLALGCVASAVDVSGTIPQGSFDGTFAWAWYEGGDCQERPHLLLRADDQPTRDPVNVDVRFPEHATVGDQMVDISLTTDSMSLPMQAVGTAHLTAAEPLSSTVVPTLAGTLEVNDNGIMLSGSFSVRQCPLLDLFCV